MYDHDTHAGPPIGLADRLHHLNDRLHALAGRLKDAIASAAGDAVSLAVRDVVRALLGPPNRHPESNRPWPDEFDGRPDGLASGAYDPDAYEDHEEDLWSRQRPPSRCPAAAPPSAESGSRWRAAVRVAAQAALWWLRTRPLRRPMLAATVVALVVGGTALVAGPAVAGGLSVAASAAALLLTADSARSAAELLTGLVG